MCDIMVLLLTITGARGYCSTAFWWPWHPLALLHHMVISITCHPIVCETHGDIDHCTHCGWCGPRVFDTRGAHRVVPGRHMRVHNACVYVRVFITTMPVSAQKPTTFVGFMLKYCHSSPTPVAFCPTQWIPPHERARSVSLTTSGLYLGSATAMWIMPGIAAVFGPGSLFKVTVI